MSDGAQPQPHVAGGTRGVGDEHRHHTSATSRARRATARLDAEEASMVLLGGTGLVIGLLLLVVTVDATAYLLAASRAQTLADHAALAAVTVSHPHGDVGGLPRSEAARIAAAGDGELLACDCPPGATIVRVEVAVDVPAVVITRYAAREVAATARAELVPPARAPPRPRTTQVPSSR